MVLIRLAKKIFSCGGNLVKGHIYDAIEKKARTGKPFRECLEESLKKALAEDIHGSSHIYQNDKKNGKVKGTDEEIAKDKRKMSAMLNKHQKD